MISKVYEHVMFLDHLGLSRGQCTIVGDRKVTSVTYGPLGMQLLHIGSLFMRMFVKGSHEECLFCAVESSATCILTHVYDGCYSSYGLRRKCRHGKMSKTRSFTVLSFLSFLCAREQTYSRITDGMQCVCGFTQFSFHFVQRRRVLDGT